MNKPHLKRRDGAWVAGYTTIYGEPRRAYWLADKFDHVLARCLREIKMEGARFNR